jgi:hypothetical protein
MFPSHGRRPDDLIDLAEEAMFDIVLTGGNGCRVADIPAGSVLHDPTDGQRAADSDACEPV